MELRQLRYFATLAETLHFGRAAELLHISQPGLSQQIRRLEEELGVVLVERGRLITLTSAGEAMATEVGPLLAHADQVRSLVREAASEVGGTLALMLTRSAPTPLTHDLLERYRARHPDVEVQIETAWTSHNVGMVRSGSADAALVQLPLLDAAGLEVIELSSAPLSVILPSAHPLARKRKVKIDDLRQEPYIGWPREQAPGGWDRLMALAWADGEPVLVRTEPDLERMISAVKDGLGFAMATHERAFQLRRAGVVVRALAPPALDYVFGLCWASDNLKPALQALVAECGARS